MSGFVWGSVTAISPLRVRLDGDTAALPFTPDSLIDPRRFAVGNRVRCELSGRRLVIHGAAGGLPPSTTYVAGLSGYPANPVQGDFVYRVDKGRTEQYFSTGAGGKAIAGWYQISGNPEVGTLAYGSGWSNISATATTTIEKSNGFVTIAFCAAKSSAITTGETILTLPAHMHLRAAQQRVDFFGANGSAAFLNFIIRPTGLIQPYNAPAGNTSVFGTCTFKSVDAPVTD